MKITVCVRKGTDGELGPFDAAAYEMALRVPDAEVTLLSMGPPAVEEWLLRLTRLGARRAVLLSDPLFAGADTLATAYTLSCALQQIPTDLLLCGRQTLVGDTGQTGPMLSSLTGFSPLAEVQSIAALEADAVRCLVRGGAEQTVPLPALLTVERSCNLRLPSIRSRVGTVEVWSAADLDADPARLGLAGSPTRVVETRENQRGRRKCKRIGLTELPEAVDAALARGKQPLTVPSATHGTLSVLTVGEAPLAYAEHISRRISVLPFADEETLTASIASADADAVLWGSDAASRMMAARIAARLGLGLCADCTSLSEEDGVLMMHRPALAGSLMAKVKSLCRPAMCTVRTTEGSDSDMVITAGFGARNALSALRTLAERYGAAFGATRRMVDEGILPYEMQVGLTGKRVSPVVYVAVGVSGAVHHLVGMERAGTVIAVNPDPKAPIFNYADFGIVATAEELASLS